MSAPKSVKCKICGKKYVSKQSLIDHIDKSHAANIPEGWNAARYENFLRTGKTEGRCVYCHKTTGWNDTTGKYNRMCGSDKCKKTARDLANKNYIGLHGKPYSINDPEQQKKMVYGRKNSGKYIFEDDNGKKYIAMYDSSYGRDFFEMIDTFLSWDGSDIIAPSPHTYWYEYEGKKHFYIPDAYSTSLNLEIEFKDGGDNPNTHPKIQAIDKVKEQKKDEVMESLKDQVNYIKICNKDYTGFFAMLSRLKQKDICPLPKWEGKLESITESYFLQESDCEYGDSQNEYLTESFETDSPSFLRRQYQLRNPLLNYTDLMNSYRKKLFHENLNVHEWQNLYNELICVRDYLKKVVNGQSDEDKRMNYEAKKALKQTEAFIQYMEEKNSAMESVVNPMVESSMTRGTSFHAIDINDPMAKKYIDKTTTKEHFDTLKRTNIGTILVDNDTDDIIGHVFVDTMKDKGFISNLWVAPKYRNHGFGSRLLNAAISNGGIDLTVKKTNKIALNMYEKHGFIKIRFKNCDNNPYYWMKLGNKLTKGDTILTESVVAMESKDIFEPGDFAEYGEFADLDAARRPIGESVNPDKIPIYIIAYRYRSPFGTMVRMKTHSDYNHVAIALTEDFEHAYTFSRRTDIDNHKMGFTEEPLSYMVSTDKKTMIKILRVYISKRSYAKLESIISEYMSHKNETTFNWSGMIDIVHKNGIDNDDIDSMSMVCSAFVDYVLKESGVDITKKPNSNLVTPEDLASSDSHNKNVAVVYQGFGRDYNINNTPLIEASHIEAMKNDTKYYPVFIFLSYTGTNMAKIIKAFTHDPYAHSSISFDTELDHMISFNRDGMVDENIFNGVYKKRADSIRYSLYVYMATADEYGAMNGFVDELLGRRSKLKYNILGLTNFIFGRGSEREDKFFCSEFVASVISAGNDRIFNRKPYMVSPYMLAKNKNFVFIKTGILKNYNSSVVDKIVAEKLEEGGFTNVTFE